jgi:hypothetical protein
MYVLKQLEIAISILPDLDDVVCLPLSLLKNGNINLNMLF